MASKFNQTGAILVASLLFSGSAAANDSYTEALTVDQGWSNADRSFFYFSPQGSPIIPLSYFMALEQPDSESPFLNQDYLREMGMIFWDDPVANPLGLPVGLTQDIGRLGNEPQLGMNCSACHVAEIRVGDTVALVDGGVSHFNFWEFMTSLDEALTQTAEDQERLNRFVNNLNEQANISLEIDQVEARLNQIIAQRSQWSARNHTNVIPGPGRVDALNVILNQVTAGMVGRPENARAADAPVSYPALWDAPYLDFVQYNGAVPNAGAGAIGRNVGQVLGVFGEVDLAQGRLPPGYNSSVNVTHLMALEERLQTLSSPAWQSFVEIGVLPELDMSLVAQGEEIYQAECASCHAVIDPVNRGDLASIHIQTFDLETIGTDPSAALGFAAREVFTGPLEGRKVGVVTGAQFCDVTHGNAVLAHVVAGVMMNHLGDDRHAVVQAAEGVIANTIEHKLAGAWNSIQSFFGAETANDAPPNYTTMINAMAAEGLSQQEIADRLAESSSNSAALFNELVQDHFRYAGEDQSCMSVLETAQYRARPLNGTWATGPYLHNGSVPTLDDLLRPASERPTSFAVTNSQFDPARVGFVTSTADQTSEVFYLDTTIPGNSNTGHEYGTGLAEADRAALLEYLKSL